MNLYITISIEYNYITIHFCWVSNMIYKNTKNQLLAESVYYAFKLFGVATIKVEIKASNNRRAQLSSFTSSKFGIAYNLFLVSFVLAFYYFALKVSFLSVIRRIHFDHIIYDLHNLSAGLTCIFILTYYCIRQERTASIASKMKIINDMMINVNNKSYDYHEKIRRSLKKILLFTSLIWIPIIATIDMDQLDVCLSYVYIQACNMTILCAMLQYSIILNYLRHILSAVNENFLKVTKNNRVQSFDSNSININHSTPQIKFDSIWQLRELYLSVCQVSDDLSQFYSPPMLLCLSHIFITLLFLSHCIIKPIFLYGVNTLPIRLILYCFFRMSQYIMSLFILTKMATAAISEVYIQTEFKLYNAIFFYTFGTN